MSTRERDQQAREEQERMEQAQREEQERVSAPRAMQVDGDNETSTNPVIINR
jgi:hypothetical protein